MSPASRRHFRFGVTGSGTSAAAFRDNARKAEDLGFSTWLHADHFGPLIAPGPAMVAAAAATSTLRVGTYVYDTDFRHAAVLAKEIATVDFLTEGRLEIGLGAGWNGKDYSMSGIPFEPARVRVDRFAETLRIIKAHLTQDEVTFRGSYFQLDQLAALPKPVQSHVPIMIGASGRRMLTLASQEADIISLQTVGGIGAGDPNVDHVAGVQEKLAIVREVAGARFDQLEFNISIDQVEVTDDVNAAADRFATKRNMTRERRSQVALGAAREP